MKQLSNDRGSAPAEFVMVGALLTILTVAIVQIGVSLYIRNVLHDAAVEGAYRAALVDGSLDDGAERTEHIISRAVGKQYAEDVTAAYSDGLGVPTIVVTVRAPLAVLGFIGLPKGVTVSGFAPRESLDVP